jgi:hypothetical protein
MQTGLRPGLLSSKLANAVGLPALGPATRQADHRCRIRQLYPAYCVSTRSNLYGRSSGPRAARSVLHWLWAQGIEVRRVVLPDRHDPKRIKAAISHMKNDGWLGRNYLKGYLGNRVNAALLSAWGQNLRKLLNWLVASPLVAFYALLKRLFCPPAYDFQLA